MILKLIGSEFAKGKFVMILWFAITAFALVVISSIGSESARHFFEVAIPIVCLILGSSLFVMFVEGRESKNGGYNLLTSLPLKISEIILSKFLVVLVSLAVCYTIVVLVTYLVGGSSDTIGKAIFGINLSLIWVGILHLGSARFGQEKFSTFAMFGVMLSGTGLLVVLTSLKSVGKELELVASLVRAGSGLLAVLISLVLYFLLFFATVRIRAKYPEL